MFRFPKAVLIAIFMGLSSPALAGIPINQCKSDQSWSRCTKEGKFQTLTLKFWGKKQPDWTVRSIKNAESPPCANAYFPVLETQEPRADNWVQLIRFHQTAPEGDQRAGFNIGPSRMDWIMVDTSDLARTKERPFIKDEARDSYFYDSPCWTFQAGDRLDWEALLFPVSISKNKIKPLGGLRWGYEFSGDLEHLKGKAVTPLNPEDWNRYREALQKAYPKWRFERAHQ